MNKINKDFKVIGDILYISNNLSIIPSMFFNNNDNIKKVIIPKNVTYIGKRAFSFCNNMEEVIFEEGSKCRYICEECFDFCTKLKKINIPDSIEYIGEFCFRFNMSLTELTIPINIKEIERYAFYGSGLSNIYIKKNVIKYINEFFLDGANKLKYVVIGNNKYNVLTNWENTPVVKKNTKILNDIYITTGKRVSDILKRNKTLWFKCCDREGNNVSYSNKLRDAYTETTNKMSIDIADVAIKENWTLDKKIQIQEYSLMSKNCWVFTKEYMKKLGIKEDDSVSIRDILVYSKSLRNYDVFCDFIDKYIIKDDGTRNGIKINLEEESNKNE